MMDVILEHTIITDYMYIFQVVQNFKDQARFIVEAMKGKNVFCTNIGVAGLLW